ncbi:MAG: hypothetical protein FWB95_00425 [Treponema sp.]|nr:hypothetical protein [Treponema sp.]
MKINTKHAIIIILPIVLFFILNAVYNARSPVLIVTEESFLQLYSGERAEKEAAKTAAALFRPVKTVTIANDAGFDIVPVAVMDVSPDPYCVIFPLRFARSAKLFAEQNPEITVIILEGSFPDTEKPVELVIGSDISNFFIYKTDINSDFYNAGLASLTLDQGKNGNIVVFTEKNLPQARENFLRALNDRGNLLETRFYTSFMQYSEVSNLSCIVLAGSGADIVENKPGTPVIMFTWIDPSLLPMDIVLVIDDSPWAQALRAVKMASAVEKTGFIKSKFRYIDRKRFGGRLLRL